MNHFDESRNSRRRVKLICISSGILFAVIFWCFMVVITEGFTFSLSFAAKATFPVYVLIGILGGLGVGHGLTKKDRDNY